MHLWCIPKEPGVDVMCLEKERGDDGDDALLMSHHLPNNLKLGLGWRGDMGECIISA